MQDKKYSILYITDGNKFAECDSIEELPDKVIIAIP